MRDSITARLLDRAAREPDRVAVHLLRSAARSSFRDEPVTMREWIHGAGTCTAAHLRRSVLLDPTLPLIEPRSLERADAPEGQPARGDEPNLIQYTSGSTGTPRGVVITADNLAANVDAMGKALQLNADDRVVSWLPMYHDIGLIGGLLAPVVHGATCWILSPLEFMLRPASWMQAISDTRATLTVAPNFAYGLVARKVVDEALRGLDRAALRAATNGAEPVDPGLPA